MDLIAQNKMKRAPQYILQVVIMIDITGYIVCPVHMYSLYGIHIVCSCILYLLRE